MDDEEIIAPETYQAFRKRVESEQEGSSYEEVRDSMKKKSEHIVELDHLAPQKHNWIDRGAVHSCENAGHPYHQVYKRL